MDAVTTEWASRKRRLRSKAWRTPRRGVRVPADLVGTDAARASAALEGRPDAVLIRSSAVWALTNERIDLPDPVETGFLGRGTSLRPGSSQLTLTEADVVTVNGFRVQRADLAGADVARLLARHAAIEALDALTNVRATSVEAIAQVLAPPTRKRGAVTARARLPEVEPGAASRKETWLRLVICDAGLPRPQAQVNIYDSGGGWLARSDLGYPELKIAIEYLGDIHRSRKSFSSDWTRQNLILLQGWVVLSFTAADLRHPSAVVARIREAIDLQRAAGLG